MRNNLQKAIDKLSYNLLYAPDYPAEDMTSLAQEKSLILQWLKDVDKLVGKQEAKGWLHLGFSTVESAFGNFDDKDVGKARKDIQAAIEYLKNAKSRNPNHIDFIAGADGMITTPSDS